MSRLFHTTVLVASALSILLLPTDGRADIYHYVDSDGNHHFTTERRSGMELVDVVRSSSGSSARRERGNERRRRPQRRHDENAYDELIREAAETYDVSFEFIKAIIKAESAFNSRAVSRAGAQGLMQLMPDTAESLGVDDSFDPRQNVFGGTRMLRILIDRYGGDINLVLAAYNAGPGAVERADDIPYEDTRRYVRTVFRYYQEYLRAAL